MVNPSPPAPAPTTPGAVLTGNRIRAARRWLRIRMLAEWLVILAVAYLYSGANLLNFDASKLQQTGEHNESATLPLLAEVSLKRYGEIPLWNPYMGTGFPHAGDLVNHFWNPVATLPVLVWGGINGMKVSIFLTFALAGIGQWLFAHVFGARGPLRLWAGLLYMLSGGLALLWRVGWYELLLGIAWFPWCFAALWWSLRRRDRASLALAAACAAMVLTAGGGYYPFYLLGGLSVLAGVSLLLAGTPASRWRRLRRSVAVATLSVGLTAVMLLPLLDGYRYTSRDAAPDPQQHFSQPIPYALINYVVSQPEWFRTEILGTAGGWNWFYIGWLPLAALALVPLAIGRARARRPALIAVAALTFTLLAWHASKYAPVKYIYNWVPFLYTLRFPNRLLILAASPLLALAGLGLQTLWSGARGVGRNFTLSVTRKSEVSPPALLALPLVWVLEGALLLVLLLSVKDVYTVNKGFAFANQSLDHKGPAALGWLKDYDPGLYYINMGGGSIFWGWTPAAYQAEMPVINFIYNRRVATFDRQRDPGTPFFATPRYIFAPPDQPIPPGAELLRDFDGIQLWRDPNALPFAFSAPPASLQPYATLTTAEAAPLAASLDGVNRVVVSGAPVRPGDQLVALVSDYPGWRLYVDGKPAEILPANGYLGAAMLPSQHTYLFAFQPAEYYVGLAISAASLALAFGLALSDGVRWPGRIPLRGRLSFRSK